MFKAGCIVLLMFGSLMSGVCIADDAASVGADEPAAPTVSVPATAAYPDRWSDQMERPGFQDNSPLARVSRIRDLPLVTFSETRGTRFFFGVNSDGVVGLHFKSK